MSKGIKIVTLLALCHVIISVDTDFAPIVVASQPESQGVYYQQVPHVVLPETIQYKTQSQSSAVYGPAGINTSKSPATYTAYPSYQFDEKTQFRSVQQAVYPITPVASDLQSAQVVAEVLNNRTIIVPTSATLPLSEPQTELTPQMLPSTPNLATVNASAITTSVRSPIQGTVMLRRVEPSSTDQSQQELASVKQKSSLKNERKGDDETEIMPKTPEGSIAFIKPSTSGLNNNSPSVETDAEPSQLFENDEGLFANSNDFRIQHESLFNRLASYTQVAPPIQLGLGTVPGYQNAEVQPSYGQCFSNNNFGQSMPVTTSSTGSGLFGGTTLPQQPTSGQLRYQSLTQLGNTMPMMAGYGMSGPQAMPSQMQQLMMPNNSSGNMPPLSSQMQMGNMGWGQMPQMQQQTIGYIILYPNAAKSGVNLQLADQSTNTNNTDRAVDGSSADNTTTASPTNVLPNNGQMQAMFVPANQGTMPNYGMQNFGMPASQPMAMQNMMGGIDPYMMNPMMGGMNPYMMNPMMSGMNPYMMNPMMSGMNPYMMNPMMMGGGMMPPIIIQSPASNAPQRLGLFARRRAARDEANASRYQVASGLNSLFTDAQRMPAKNAYPYGYFGASSAPYQTGNFGGYHDSYFSNTTFPGTYY